MGSHALTPYATIRWERPKVAFLFEKTVKIILGQLFFARTFDLIESIIFDIVR